MRSRRPSLLGTVVRTAVIAKTAKAVIGPGSAPAAAASVAEAPVAAASAAGGGITAESMALLQQLTELHKAGALTDAEFSAQKARLLA